MNLDNFRGKHERSLVFLFRKGTNLPKDLLLFI